MPGLFDDPTPQELMEQKRILEDLNEMRAKVNADIAKEKARQAEEPQPKRHRPEVDQFALAAKRMARNKPMPQPEVHLTASSSNVPATATVITQEQEVATTDRRITTDGITTTTSEHEVRQINRVVMTFPGGKHELMEGKLQIRRAKEGGPDYFQRFKAHFTSDIKTKDLGKYPWVHFIIPAMCMEQKTDLTYKIKALDKEALVDFITINTTTSLLVYKPSRTKKLAGLVPAIQTERLKQEAVRGNRSKNNVEQMLMKRAEVGEHLTNFWLAASAGEMYPDHVYTLQELYDYLDKCLTFENTRADFRHVIEDARQAKAQKKQSTLQQAILTSEKALTEFVDDKSKCAGMIFSAEEAPGMTWWDDYPQHVKDIKGWYYDEKVKKIKECTMWEFTTKLDLKRSAFIIGPAGIGKSTLQRLWARFWCRSAKKTKFIEGKSIDPLGILSKDGRMQDFGALCLSDFDFRTCQDHMLTKDEQKSVVSVFENGACVARYGDAIFPKELPRTFSVNLGRNEMTGQENDPAAWFDFKMDGLACLVRKQEAAIQGLQDNELALVRRCAVFVLDESMNLHVDNEAMEDEFEEKMLQRQMNREQCLQERNS